jgi:hypothetical protein
LDQDDSCRESFVRFLTEPEDWHGYYEHWMQDGPIPCTTDDCDGCNSDDPDEKQRIFRYLANAYVVDDQKVMAVKMPKTLVENLMVFRDKYKTIVDRDYDLTKTGSGKEGTKYFATPDSPKRLKTERFDGQLHDLAAILQSLLGEEYEPPGKSSKSGKVSEGKPKKSKDKDPWNDEAPAKKKKKKSASSGKSTRTVKKGASKPAVKRTVKRTK